MRVKLFHDLLRPCRSFYGHTLFYLFIFFYYIHMCVCICVCIYIYVCICVCDVMSVLQVSNIIITITICIVYMCIFIPTWLVVSLSCSLSWFKNSNLTQNTVNFEFYWVNINVTTHYKTHHDHIWSVSCQYNMSLLIHQLSIMNW